MQLFAFFSFENKKKQNNIHKCELKLKIAVPACLLFMPFTLEISMQQQNYYTAEQTFHTFHIKNITNFEKIEHIFDYVLCIICYANGT